MPVSIKIVSSKSDVMRFIQAQWNFYHGDPNFVPPILMDRKKLLDREKNPFYKHSEMEMFLAERDGKVVGRIAAIANYRHNEIHNDKIGFFGFFECEDNKDTAKALLDAAADWLRKKGRSDMRGPVNPSMNDEVGLLVEGFNEPPVVLMTYNPKYYANLLEGYGLEKIKDLYAYRLRHKDYRTEKLSRLTDVIRERYKVTLRNFDFRNKEQFRRDVEDIKRIYNQAWEPNWGFVKLTDEEFDFLVADLKQIANPEFVYIAESEGQTAGFLLALPNINRALIHNKRGSLLGALWCLLTKKKKIDAVRIVVMGVLPEFKNRGLDAYMYNEIGARTERHGMTWGEASWILEDNIEMNKAAVRTMNGERYKTYRIYQKAL